MAAVEIGELNSDAGRIAVLNDGTGAKIIASNQCGDFPFKLTKMIDPRVDIDSIADYDKNVVAYVGARNWNKFKYKKDYTNPSQLKFSNIKTPGASYLVDMKWWLNYQVKIKFTKFPHPVDNIGNGALDPVNVFKDNIMCLRPFPLHQCTDNIHLRLNNRDLISYPIQTLNQRMEYWRQDKLKESCGFCPHRKPNVQTTYELGDKNIGRSPFMNLGAPYDSDFGNECVIDDQKIKYEDMVANPQASTYEDIGGEADDTLLPFGTVDWEISFWMREPVMSEPLDYYSSRQGSKTMNNITSIDLEYNFNNLRNMILFNHNEMLKKCVGKEWVEELEYNNCKFAANTQDWWSEMVEKNLNSILSVSIEDAELEIDIATPQVPPSMPFVTDYVEYRRYETILKDPIDPTGFWNKKDDLKEIHSDIYSLTYMPNSIYIWVAPQHAKVYGDGYRCFYNNSYAQITSLEVDYGNLTKIGNHYGERDLYLMSLRNGLEDRSYADWTRTKRTFYRPYINIENLDTLTAVNHITENEFFGVGSVLRVVPGIDLCSGGEQTLIGGMKITNETIRFHVKFRPLNMFDDNLVYSLFVAFEYNGICTITPGFCDLAMIHIDSYNQIANAERAPRYRISRIYGKGLWDKVKKVVNGVNNFAKKTHAVSKVLGMMPFAGAQTAAKVASKMGYGYGGGSRSTKMRGGMIIPPGSFYRTY